MAISQSENTDSKIYRFDQFSFDSKKLSLRQNGDVVPLKIQPARLLKILLEQAPDFAPRQLLQDKIWDNGTTVEFDRGLNVCVNQLRAALGDKASEPRFIATLPKRGYNFISPIEADIIPAKSGGLIRFGGIAILIASALAALWFFFLNGEPQQSKRVYVAPVQIADDSLSGFDGVAQYALRLGAVERLGQGDVAVVQAINGTSLWQKIDGSNTGSPFDYSIFLTLKRGEEQYIVDAIVIAAKSNRIVDQKEFRLTTPDAVSLSKTSDEVAIWAGALFGAKDVVAGRLEQEGPPAYFNAMIRAQRSFRSSDPESLKQSLDWFEKALAISPNSVDAEGGQALSLALLSGGNGFPVTDTYSRAMQSAERIRSTAGPTAQSELVRGFIYLYRDWDLVRSRRAFDLALDLAPGDAMVHAMRAGVLAAQDDIKSAADEAELAVKLDPLSMAINSDRCWYLSAANQLKQAIDACSWVLEINPNHYTARMTLASVFERSNREQDAVEILQPTNASQKAKGSQSLPDRYCELTKRFEVRARKSTFPMTELAALQAKCGNYKGATASLQKARQSGESGFLFYGSDPRFDVFRKQPAARNIDLKIKKRT